MNETKLTNELTPGPFHVAACQMHGPNDGLVCLKIRKADGTALEPTYADLLVQAAGPALLASLEELVARREKAGGPHFADGSDGRYARARAAIALAKPRKAEPEPPYLYAIVRKDFKSGPLLVQSGHALTECLQPQDLPLPDNTRLVFLGATKEEMAVVKSNLTLSGIRFKEIVEVDGVLKGVTTAIGLFVRNREMVKPLLAHLKPYRD